MYEVVSLFDIERWLPFLLAKSHQMTFNLMKNAVEPYGLTPPQFATLSFLWKCDGINQQQLGCLMSVDRTTIGGIVERLEKLEYVMRGNDPEDRRSWVVNVTAKGKSLKEEVLKDLDNVTEAIDSKLTEEEQVQLTAILKKLRGRKNNQNCEEVIK